MYVHVTYECTYVRRTHAPTCVRRCVRACVHVKRVFVCPTCLSTCKHHCKYITTHMQAYNCAYIHTYTRERIVYIRVHAVCGRQHPSAVDHAAATDVLILASDVIVQVD